MEEEWSQKDKFKWSKIKKIVSEKWSQDSKQNEIKNYSLKNDIRNHIIKENDINKKQNQKAIQKLKQEWFQGKLYHKYRHHKDWNRKDYRILIFLTHESWFLIVQ